MPIIVDLIMIGLLVGVIIYTTRLSQSLHNFKALHAEITPLMRDHSQTITNSVKSLSDLRRLSEEVNKKIIVQSQEYLTLKSDLQFLYDRAMSACDRLETLIKQEREIAVSPPAPKAKSAPKKKKAAPKLHGNREDSLNALFAEKAAFPLEISSLKAQAVKLLKKQRERGHAA